MIKNFRHIGIVVNNIEKALNFYNKILGFNVIKKTEEKSSFIDKILQMHDSKLTTWKLEIPDGKIIELLHFEKKGKVTNPIKANDVGITHFALTVENVDALYNCLMENNVEILSLPQTSPDLFAKVIFCRDYENNLIEFVELLK